MTTDIGSVHFYANGKEEDWEEETHRMGGADNLAWFGRLCWVLLGGKEDYLLLLFFIPPIRSLIPPEIGFKYLYSLFPVLRGEGGGESGRVRNEGRWSCDNAIPFPCSRRV